ncbi:hypothetical protein KSP40_PGU020979 [Platanthera guangdongensis]|uniref:CHCH domain-containing protein n=1 Tax=Platanthera guangdongensis TaxID=2320717 RepID=A0ABR2LEW7_9ASPA
MESTTPRPECAKQALDLLNCAAEPDFDQEKCIRFLAALRNCIQDKVFSNFQTFLSIILSSFMKHRCVLRFL